jgi:transposase
MTRPKGRSIQGSRIYSFQIPRPRRLTLISAITTDGVMAEIQVNGSVDGSVFLYFIKEHLVPALKPGQVILMDNYCIHKVEGVEKAIKEAGCSLLKMPAYSPDFNPIELYFSNLKHLVRSQNTKTITRFRKVLKKALRPSEANVGVPIKINPLNAHEILTA